ncbi:MAG: hypothetical protein ACI9HK_004080 [Pirellulaceae bacterium]|jgi:hypothetical protein
MAVQANDFVLTNLGVNAPAAADTIVNLSAANVEINNEVVVLKFGSDELLDGVYELQILSTAEDRRGNQVDGDGNGIGGDGFLYQANNSNKFYQLSADWNGDAGVSVFDFTTFSYWFGSEVPAAPSYADVNNDGGVSVFDFTPFSDNFGVAIVYETAFATSVEFSTTDRIDFDSDAIALNQQVETIAKRIDSAPARIDSALARIDTETTVREFERRGDLALAVLLLDDSLLDDSLLDDSLLEQLALNLVRWSGHWSPNAG